MKMKNTDFPQKTKKDSGLPDLMTVKETAEYLGISMPQVYWLVQHSQLPCRALGPRWRVVGAKLDREAALAALARADERERGPWMMSQ